MKADKFTKVILLIIAIFLGIIALKPLSQLPTAIAGQSTFDDVKFVPVSATADILLFDIKSRKLWHYDVREGIPKYMGKLVEAGKPFEK
jgi:hypothetical protein